MAYLPIYNKDDGTEAGTLQEKKKKVIHLISTIIAHEAYSKENLVACWMGS